jgi:hypothetical protein
MEWLSGITTPVLSHNSSAALEFEDFHPAVPDVLEPILNESDPAMEAQAPTMSGRIGQLLDVAEPASWERGEIIAKLPAYQAFETPLSDDVLLQLAAVTAPLRIIESDSGFESYVVDPNCFQKQIEAIAKGDGGVVQFLGRPLFGCRQTGDTLREARDYQYCLLIDSK